MLIYLSILMESFHLLEQQHLSFRPPREAHLESQVPTREKRHGNSHLSAPTTRFKDRAKQLLLTACLCLHSLKCVPA